MANQPYLLLHVASPAASARFYGDLFGREPVDASDTFVLFALETGLMLGLWDRARVLPATAGAPGATEIGVRLDDYPAVDKAHGDWAARGIGILMPPTDLDFGRSFVATDPDGHRIRVYALAA